MLKCACLLSNLTPTSSQLWRKTFRVNLLTRCLNVQAFSCQSSHEGTKNSLHVMWLGFRLLIKRRYKSFHYSAYAYSRKCSHKWTEIPFPTISEHFPHKVDLRQWASRPNSNPALASTPPHACWLQAHFRCLLTDVLEVKSTVTNRYSTGNHKWNN